MNPIISDLAEWSPNGVCFPSYEKSSDHDINDILSTRTDRTALKQQQFNRAQEARNTRTTQACFIRTTSFGGQSNA